LGPVYPSFALLIGIVVGEKVGKKLFKRLFNFSCIFLIILLYATSIFPLYFGKINSPDKSELKKLTPYIQALTEHNDQIAVFRMNYWGVVADFAFYVDRPIRVFEKEKDFAFSLSQENSYGYIKKEDYSNLSDQFKMKYLPIIETKNFFFITNGQNLSQFKNKAFPFIIY
jgi:hypothetical protein